jgi:hypothetical protein
VLLVDEVDVLTVVWFFVLLLLHETLLSLLHLVFLHLLLVRGSDGYVTKVGGFTAELSDEDIGFVFFQLRYVLKIFHLPNYMNISVLFLEE